MNSNEEKTPLWLKIFGIPSGLFVSPVFWLIEHIFPKNGGHACFLVLIAVGGVLLILLTIGSWILIISAIASLIIGVLL